MINLVFFQKEKKNLNQDETGVEASFPQHRSGYTQELGAEESAGLADGEGQEEGGLLAG